MTLMRGPARSSGGAAGAQRGSALILVLVCLVMMVLLGTAYIQIARVDRRATRQLTATSNMDTVRDAVIAYIKLVLKDDLVDYKGDFFLAGSSKDPSASPAHPAFPSRVGETGFDEFIDYPFTNTSVTYPVKSYRTATFGNTLGNAAGGLMDDTWLASGYMNPENPTSPTGASLQNTSWSHLSNLRGIFLRLPKSGTSTLTEPEERITGTTPNYFSSNPLNHDGFGEVFVDPAGGGDRPTSVVYSLPMTPTNSASLDYTTTQYDRMGTDTDGDGILDAAWTWAPDEVRQIGSTTYVVAYRIIDLSGMVNVNVATALTTDGNFAAGTVPELPRSTVQLAARGAYPTDLDLSRLFAKSVNRGPSWQNQLKDMLAFRGVPSSPNFPSVTHELPLGPGIGDVTPAIGSTAYVKFVSEFGQPEIANRANAWLDGTLGARVYGRMTGRFAESDEVELRSRGGLNTSVPSPLEGVLPNLLRTSFGPEVEIAYKNVSGISDATVNRGTTSYMQGSSVGLNGGAGLTGRNFPALRHMLTTSSGANILANQYPGISGAVDRLQVDLVYQNSTTDSPNAARIRAEYFGARLAKIFKVGSPTYLNLSSSELEEVAYNYAACIVDYMDDDSTPTRASINGKYFYGLEIMPFITEVYMQGAYQSAMPDLAAMPPVFKEWQYIPGTGGFVIEVANPFDKPCSFAGGGAGIALRIVIRKEGSSNLTPMYKYDVKNTDITGTLGVRDSNQVSNKLVFYANPTVPTPEGGSTNKLQDDLGLTAAFPGSKIIPIAALPDAAFDGSPLVVELQVGVDTDGGGQTVYATYDRLRDPKLTFPAKYVKTHGDGMNVIKATTQIDVARDGTKIRYLSNKGRAATVEEPNESNTYRQDMTSFGKDSKGASGDTEFDKFHLALANHQIFNVAELAYIFMVGFEYDVDNAAGDGDIPMRLSGRNGEQSRTSTDTTKPSAKARQFLSFATDGSHTPAQIAASIPSETRIPHFSMVMDQFTTLSPAYDETHGNSNDPVDNDQNGVANDVWPGGVPKEGFVPGRLNVNTAPTWLMAITSPIPEPLAELEQLYQAIGEYRDRPESREIIAGISNLVAPNVASSKLAVDPKKDKGIRSIGELMLINKRVYQPNTSANSPQNMMRYADGQHFEIDNAMRHYPHYDDRDIPTEGETGRVKNPLDILDSQEFVEVERMARFQYLTNTLTTRSDRFCAYVSIRGYPTGAFNQAPSETLRFFVILDRSQLTHGDGEVTHYPKTGQKN